MNFKARKEATEILQVLAKIYEEYISIEVSLGYVKAGTVHNGLVIKSAPPIFTEKLSDMGFSLDITSEGVHVYRIGGLKDE